MPAAVSRTLQFQTPHTVHLSEKERTTGIITDEHVAEAVSAVHRDGLVVLENAVDTAHCDELNEILRAEADVMAKLPTTHFNDNSIGGKPTGNMSQGPPLEPHLMHTDIWANIPAATITTAILGPSPRVNYVNGNTNLGGFNGARQRVHADLTFNHASFPFALVTNYYLEDVSEKNGVTELWLGSHRDTTFRDHLAGHPVDPDTNGNGEDGEEKGKKDGRVGAYDKTLETKFGIRDELLEARRAFAPPVRPSIKKGSVIIRDLRLWHAGHPNPSPNTRIMLAFVHTPWWYRCPAKVVLPEEARALVEGWKGREVSPVAYHAHFVGEGVNSKEVKFTPNFSSDNTGYLDMLPKDVVMGFVFDGE